MKYKSSSKYIIICESKGNLFSVWLCPGIHHFKMILYPSFQSEQCTDTLNYYV